MKWMIPINQLDVVQASVIDEIVNDRHADHLVTGFAGTGKTIVLTHVLERLASSGTRRIAFATYTHALKDLVESGLTARTRSRVDITTFDALKRAPTRYDILVADELQDVTKRHYQSFEDSYRRLVAAADFDQRIYRQAANRETIEALLDDADGHELQEIHRVNENIFRIATTILDAHVPSAATDWDDAELTRLLKARTKRQEFTTVYSEASRLAAKEHPSAILFPTRKLLKTFVDLLASEENWGAAPELQNPDNSRDKYGPMNRFLRRTGSALQVFGSGSGEMATSDERAVVYLMTYHSAKGLDFPNVFLPHLTSDTSLQAMANASDEEERRMFFVAATRAKQRLHLSYHGEPHRFLSEIDEDLLTPLTQPKRTY